jgi:hypothetical protein
MVAIPSWFWIEGYDGRPFGPPIGRMEVPAAIGPQVPISPLFPADCECREPTYLTVELRLQPVRFAWSFGDDSAPHLTRSLGPAYPQVSEIRHTYEYSSRVAPGGGFSVQVNALYEAAFRVDGSEWESLGQVVAHPTIVRHEVRDLQTVLVGGEFGVPPPSRGR